MKNSIWALSVGLVLAGVSIARCDDAKKPQSMADYLTQLQTKLDHTARRANQPTAEGSAVVGLRGSKQESASQQLYWKGKKGKVEVAPEEVKDFRAAIDLAHAGKTMEADASLKAFEEKYPQSAMLPDVKETRKRLAANP